MASEFYFSFAGSEATAGPVSLGELALRWREGALTDDSLVWSESALTPGDGWLPLEQCSELLTMLEEEEDQLLEEASDEGSGGDGGASSSGRRRGSSSASPSSPRARSSSRVVANYDFEGDAEDGELSFAAGDTIRLTQVVDDIDDGWWRGYHEGRGEYGLFPASYVRDADNAMEASAEKRANAADGNVAARARQPSAAAAASVTSSSPPSAEAKKKKSQFVIDEIVGTESRYAADLALLRDEFAKPILAGAIGSIDAAVGGALLALFGQCETIANLNSTFVLDLEKRKSAEELDAAGVCASFKLICPYLKLYTPYMNGFRAAMESLDRLVAKDRKFVAFCEPHGGTSKLMSLLIKPVQRIPRYRLLLEELQKQCGKERACEEDGGELSPIDAVLEETIEIVKSVASACNAGVQDQADAQILLRLHARFVGSTKVALIPSRRLLREGVLAKTNRKGGSDARTAILFSDVLILARETNSSKNDDLEVRSALYLSGCSLVRAKHSVRELCVLSRVKSVRLRAADDSAFAMWNDALTDAIEAAKSTGSPRGRAGSDSPVTFAPLWDVDTESTRCSQCSAAFGTFKRRRHHCRQCGKLVCGQCSGKTWRMPPDNEKKRVCDRCYEELRSPFAAPKFTQPPALPRRTAPSLPRRTAPPLPPKAGSSNTNTTVQRRRSSAGRRGSALLGRMLSDNVRISPTRSGDGNAGGTTQRPGRRSAIDSLERVRGSSIVARHGSTAIRTNAEADAMRNALQKQLHSRSSNHVLIPSQSENVRTAFTVALEQAPLFSPGSGAGSSAPARPQPRQSRARVGSAPPALPTRGKDYAKLIAAVMSRSPDERDEVGPSPQQAPRRRQSGSRRLSTSVSSASAASARRRSVAVVAAVADDDDAATAGTTTVVVKKKKKKSISKKKKKKTEEEEEEESTSLKKKKKKKSIGKKKKKKTETSPSVSVVEL